MKHHKTGLIGLACFIAFAPFLRAGEVEENVPLEIVEPSLDKNDSALLAGIEVDIRPQLDATLFTIDGSPPGFLVPDGPGDDLLFAPRLTLPVDVFVNDWIYGFGKFRFDRGFDPGSSEHELRADEYFFRFGSGNSPIQFQAGKFATVFGGWVQRHDTDDNAFVNAPLVYNELTSLIDNRLFPNVGALAANQGRQNVRNSWVPVMWDAAYIPGFAVFGKLSDKVEIAAEVKSQTSSSQPEDWENWNFSDPTFTSRIGYRPNASWNLGASASQGTYLLGQFDQTTLGLDASYSHRHWQIWGEFVYSKFELPNIADDAVVLSYFIESRYKFTPQAFTALRWNHQLYNTLDTPLGAVAWDNDVHRVDAAVGYRINENLEIKLQYSRTHHDAVFQNGENMVGLQVTARLR